MEDDTLDHPQEHPSDHDSDAGVHEFESGHGSTDALLPVTLRQVLEATPLRSGFAAPWSIGGRKVKKITVVATVLEETHKRETRTTHYKLIDGTNGKSVLAFRYIEGEFEPVIPLPLREGVLMIMRHRYVRILGSLSAMRGGGTAINVEGFHVVEDFNEVFVHRLWVLTAGVGRQKGPPPAEVLRNISDSAKYPARELVAKTSQEPPLDLPRNPQRSSSTYANSIDSRPDYLLAHASLPGPVNNDRPLCEPSTYEHVAQATPKPTLPLHSTRETSQPRQPSAPQPGKGKEREREARRLSVEDPLSGLTPLQRTVLLKIMEGTTLGSESSLDVMQLAVSLKTDNGTEDAAAITDALDVLLDEGHISTDSEGVTYRAISQRSAPLYSSLYRT